jgi:hypothetical protein
MRLFQIMTQVSFAGDLFHLNLGNVYSAMSGKDSRQGKNILVGHGGAFVIATRVNVHIMKQKYG